MTWVVGATTPFGYAVLLSDTCISFPDGSTRDLVQKAYSVGNSIVAGFAGSVPLGFKLLNDLQMFLRLEEGEEDCYWQPEWVAQNWSVRARAIFEDAAQTWQDAGSHILIVAVHPHESSLGNALPYISVLKGPDFNPETVHGPYEFRSIGSGAHVEAYQELLGYFSTDSGTTLLQAEIGSPAGFGRVLASTISRTAYQNSARGISEHMHIFIVGLGQIQAMTNDFDIFPDDGDPIKVRMPPVARNMNELLNLISASEADCSIATTNSSLRRPKSKYSHRD